MQTITTKYIGPTNFRGARIRVKASGGIRRFYSYQYEAKNPHDVAVCWFCAELKWSGTFHRGDLENGGYAYVHGDSEPLVVTGG